MNKELNYSKVKEYLDEKIPKLSFSLASESPVIVDTYTINRALDLAESFTPFTHPQVLEFLELVAESEGDLPEEVVEILMSRGYLRFLFWLTVYCGELPTMVELHAINYAPQIGIDIQNINSVEFFPHIKDKALEKNPHAVAFNGDINKVIAFVNTLDNSFVRYNFVDGVEEGYRDVSTVDVLGYT